MKEKKFITREMTPEEMLLCKTKSKYKTSGLSKKVLDQLAREYAIRGINLLNAVSEERRDIEFMDKRAEGKIPFDQEFVLEMCKHYEDLVYQLIEPLFDEFIPYAFAPDGDLKSKPVAIRKMITYFHNCTKNAVKRLKQKENSHKDE